jgi:hydrogenase maturation factor
MPGRVTSIDPPIPGATMGLVEFGDRTLKINLVMLPDVEIGDHILVHSGYAIRTVAEPALFPEVDSRTS